jgi:hypothetical protein
MRVLENSPLRIVPAPLCQCECRACDIGIHCSKQNCGHRSQRITPSVTSRRPVASAALPVTPALPRRTGTFDDNTLPFS